MKRFDQTIIKNEIIAGETHPAGELRLIHLRNLLPIEFQNLYDEIKEIINSFKREL